LKAVFLAALCDSQNSSAPIFSALAIRRKTLLPSASSSVIDAIEVKAKPNAAPVIS